MLSSKDAARMQQRASAQHANPYSFPPTPGSGLLGSTTRRRSTSQTENLRHSWQAALENLSTEPLERAASL